MSLCQRLPWYLTWRQCCFPWEKKLSPVVKRAEFADGRWSQGMSIPKWSDCSLCRSFYSDRLLCGLHYSGLSYLQFAGNPKKAAEICASSSHAQCPAVQLHTHGDMSFKLSSPCCLLVSFCLLFSLTVDCIWRGTVLSYLDYELLSIPKLENWAGL